MSASTVEYRRAETVDEALDVLAARPDATVLASGHSVLPQMNDGGRVPEFVLDIGPIASLRGVEVGDETVSIGALTTYATVEHSERLAAMAPALTESVRRTADTQIRNRSTVGGNLATPYPASDLSVGVLAAGGTLVVRGPDGERRLDAASFFTGKHATALAPDELLVAIEVPRVDRTVGGTYVKRTEPCSRYTLVGVAARLTVEDGEVASAAVAALGAADHAVSLDAVTAALERTQADSETFEAAAARAADSVDESARLDSDGASATHRKRLLEAATREALEGAAASSSTGRK